MALSGTGVGAHHQRALARIEAHDAAALLEIMSTKCAGE
jgi:hypothetical protein